MSTHSSSSLLGISLLASFVAMGGACAASAPHPATMPSVVIGSRAQVDEDAPLPVERAPGELTLRRAAKTATAKQAQPTDDETVEWTDCSRGAKVCTAKGFVYDKVSPAMPDINAHAAPSDGEVAHR